MEDIYVRPLAHLYPPHIGSRFICTHITPIICHQLDIKPREIIARMKSKFDIKVLFVQPYRGRSIIYKWWLLHVSKDSSRHSVLLLRGGDNVSQSLAWTRLSYCLKFLS
ncbi:hypothetical protein M5K25_019676 [Dendrobium thyrsiflorum]|uniref:Uncharacterized protein n=1 Tax=Dendrobium thyrsiflorum TaxID=117978 RepID=A0ABD0UFW3_DENTH